MRLEQAGVLRSIGGICVRAAILIVVTVTVFPVQAQSPSVAHRSKKAAGKADLVGSKLKEPAAEMKLLGAPSDLDIGYLEGMGGPPEDSASPGLSLTEEPATPTEILLMKGAGSHAPSSVRNKASAVLASSPTRDTAFANTDQSSSNVIRNPYMRPADGATVYQSPW